MINRFTAVIFWYFTQFNDEIYIKWNKLRFFDETWTIEYLKSIAFPLWLNKNFPPKLKYNTCTVRPVNNQPQGVFCYGVVCLVRGWILQGQVNWDKLYSFYKN